MSVGRPLWEPGRRAAACVAIATAVALVAASAASADTAFGGNPNQEVIPEVTSEISCAPFTCTLFWAGPGGNDLVPIGPSGGVGTVTSVTLPPLVDPGTMQAIVLTSTITATKEPGHTTTSCCTVKELSAPFTVPANQVTTVPLSLHVSATAAVNPNVPGDTATVDGVGISVTTAEASAPLHATENPADVVELWAPALTAPTSTTTAPFGERQGYELEARFTYAETPGAKPPAPPGSGPGSPGTGTGAGPGAAGGIVLHHGVLRPGHDGRTIVLGSAANPPTASTRQTLSIPAAVVSKAAGARSRKSIVIGRGRTTVAEGRRATLKLILNHRGRIVLAERRKLRATLTVLAEGTEGKSETVTRRVTVRPFAAPRRPS